MESCGRCLPGWFLFNTTCYFHSQSLSNPLKNWSDSRDDCISRGANLTVIDNWEEQVSLVCCRWKTRDEWVDELFLMFLCTPVAFCKVPAWQRLQKSAFSVVCRNGAVEEVQPLLAQLYVYGAAVLCFLSVSLCILRAFPIITVVRKDLSLYVLLLHEWGWQDRWICICHTVAQQRLMRGSCIVCICFSTSSHKDAHALSMEVLWYTLLPTAEGCYTDVQWTGLFHVIHFDMSK